MAAVGTAGGLVGSAAAYLIVCQPQPHGRTLFGRLFAGAMRPWSSALAVVAAARQADSYLGHTLLEDLRVLGLLGLAGLRYRDTGRHGWAQLLRERYAAIWPLSIVRRPGLPSGGGSSGGGSGGSSRQNGGSAPQADLASSKMLAAGAISNATGLLSVCMSACLPAGIHLSAASGFLIVGGD
eukprot:SAG22_NODE_8080_length_685_cov_1.054608_1_plen_181_part_10